MTEVIVFGANGRTGRIIVEKLLNRGHIVTAAVRNPAAFSDVMASTRHPERLRTATVDVDDPSSVLASVNGQAAAISAIGTGRKPNGLYSRGTRNIVSALETLGSPRFLCISSGGAHRNDPNLGFFFRRIIIPFFMNELYADMDRMEEIVRASPLDWILVRPGYLTDEPGRDRWRVREGTNPRGGWKISRHDLAAFVVDQLDSPVWSRRHPTITW